MDNIIQNMLNDNTNHFVELPPGEFEGPFVINRSCAISGFNTTLWSEKGPVVEIKSKGVGIKNVRIEPISDDTALVNEYSGNYFENVEISGSIKGVEYEDGLWKIPKVVKLDMAEPGKPFSYSFEVTVPIETRVVSLMKGIDAVPETLKVGKNIVTLNIDAPRPNTYIYGDIIFISKFIRRTYISGRVSGVEGNIDSANNATIPIEVLSNNQSVQAVQSPIVQQQYSNTTSSNKNSAQLQQFKTPDIPSDAVLLKKGQRIALGTTSPVTIEAYCQKMPQNMDIDPYVFLLNGNNKAENDESLIFFGNEKSADNSAEIISSDNKISSVLVSPQKVGASTERISIAYGIYEENDTFSSVGDILILIKSEGKTIFAFNLDYFTVETIFIALELYRYKGQWKISVIGAGYSGGIKKLCESYGIEVVG